MARMSNPLAKYVSHYRWVALQPCLFMVEAVLSEPLVCAKELPASECYAQFPDFRMCLAVRYHGLDRVFGYLLQSVVMNEPEDPVGDLIQKVRLDSKEEIRHCVMIHIFRDSFGAR
jgi:hypothetical protein